MKANQVLLQEITPELLQELIKDAIHTALAVSKKDLKRRDEKEDLLTREEAAQLLRIHPSTLWHWTKNGKIRSYGIAGRLYYKYSEIMEALTLINKRGVDND